MLPILMIIAFIIIIAIAVVRLTKKGKAEGPDRLQQLLEEKAELEESVSLAKNNYYKRRIDEESLQKTVKESQDKIFIIKQKIARIKKGQ
jgi:hypothetical protein